MTSENSMHDTEDVLLALFDAHSRVDCEQAEKEIARTAVDWVERNEEDLEKRAER